MGPFGTNPQRLDSEGRHIADDEPEHHVSLAEEMLRAADVLEAVSGLYDAANPNLYPWSADELRREAPHVASEAAL